MAKKEPTKTKAKTSSTRFSPRFILLALLLAGAWGLWHSDWLSDWKDRVLQYVDNQDIVTLESRYAPEQIVEAHRTELLGNDGKKTLQNTTLKYLPYLLLDIKYTDDLKTREGVVLWGLNDGEIVLNTDTWETTHGFRDCLDCKATRSDFKILQVLAKRQAALSVDDLQKELKIERDVLLPWIEEAKQKHLIVQKGNLLQLHFENPKLLANPQTRVAHHLVSKPLGEDQKIARNYSKGQVLAMAQAAFGNDFKVRSEQDIFLPVYSFEVANPDGSVQVSDWNALTGQRIVPHYLSKS